MPPFRFGLQQVLDYREQRKQQAQIALGHAQANLTREKNRADELDAMIIETEERLYGNAVLDIGERWLLEHFVRGLRSDAAETKSRLQTLTEHRDAMQAELILRAKEEKVLEKLKEKQAARHVAEEKLKELRSYDETAAIRYKIPAF